jgi:catechol 2,3-dioxygenase-like lactoylglutathione lyase family enzyme
MTPGESDTAIAPTPALAPATGVHHVGLTVSDLDRSIEWYGKVLGLRETMRSGGSGPIVSELMQVPDADVTAVFMKIGDVHVELLHHKTDGRPFDRNNNDIGAMHMCFLVDDVDAAYEALKKEGIELNAPPLYNTAGALEGWGVLYFRDPDGVQLEFFSRPD